METKWPAKTLSEEAFQNHVLGFWRHATWVAKKTLRGEVRAAVRWSHVELREHAYALLAEEAQLEGRAARPEARQAERWLTTARLGQTAHSTGPDQRLMALALLQEIALFEDVSRVVASRRGFVAPDHSALAGWLRTELSRLGS